MHGDVGQNLAIDFDLGLVQAVDQAAVGQFVQTGCSIDTRNPQCTKLTFTLATITIGILTCLGDSLVGSLKQPAAGTVVALGFA